MKKIVRQQNYLKELIESQENQVISKQALRCVSRSILEPLLDSPEEDGVVLHRIFDKSGILGLLQRLEFSQVKSYDFSDESENLREKVWANTEFLCVLTHRFVVILLWDNKTENSYTVRYYTIWNSKLQNEALDIIGRNTTIDIKELQEKYKPDRRDNLMLNKAIKNLVENMDEASKDAVLGFAQVQYEKEEEKAGENTREVAHEIKNHLSICDLYTEVIKKHCLKNGIKEDTISNALKCLARAIKMASNSLISLKASDKNTIKQYKLSELVGNATELSKVYLEDKNIDCIIENDLDVKVPADENKFISAIVNLIKNASEAFSTEETPEKYVKISTEDDGDFAIIKISNNAGKIDNPERIFKEGFTTKQTGNGLGLHICKKSIEEMYGKLTLEHTGDDYTEFAIRIAKVR